MLNGHGRTGAQKDKDGAARSQEISMSGEGLWLYFVNRDNIDVF